MFRISTNTVYQRGLEGILKREHDLSEVQMQVSSGKAFLKPSDDPSGSARVLDFNRVIENTEQYQRNILSIKNRLAIEDNVLDGLGKGLRRIRELALQGSSETYTPDQQAYLAKEVRILLDDMVSLANSQDSSGDYIFAGYQGSVRPFELVGGNYVFNGDMGQRQIRVSDDRTIADSDSGFEVFMDIATSAGGTRNAFETVDQIATSLESGVAVGTLLDDLQLVMENVLEIRAGVGARQNAVDQHEIINEDFILTMEENRAKIEDLDYAEALTRFSQLQTALEAAQKTFISLQGLSLFNFLRL
ncbi:flagellar hook-associated protein 3 [Solemya velesiana gill symbiont]|uniref:Flagellar hook-associated protein 3 n=2 Tax=Solemya velesiana gill symbiont TaxID=1918948 RepID=A0A1T2KYC3_9GAMM|nr:flagellar hook-associated protein 3 [Solemya velesiana gill symbiont]